MTKFEIGKTYATRSICDHDTWFSFVILARTEKQVTIKVNGKPVRRGLTIRDGIEQFKPYGSYSMCAIIGADDARRDPTIGHCSCGSVLSAVTGDCVRGIHCRD